MDIGAMMSKETLKIMVTKTLEAVEQTRNDDIVLTTEIWKRYYPEYLRIDALGNQFVYLRSLNLLPREDNVKRIRAKLQNDCRQSDGAITGSEILVCLNAVTL